jgi:hypothetical protein
MAASWEERYRGVNLGVRRLAVCCPELAVEGGRGWLAGFLGESDAHDSLSSSRSKL